MAATGHRRDHHQRRRPHRRREAPPGDEHEQRRRDDHAAAAGAGQREAHRHAALADEPGRDEDVDGRATHARPAQRHRGERGVELPEAIDRAERRLAERHRQHAGHHDAMPPARRITAPTDAVAPAPIR
jgi:hypothetical protein